MSRDVCNGVRAIMASFVDGLDVTTSLRERTTRKKKSKHDDATAVKETSALSRSLQESPWIIGQEYENGLRRLGPRFAHGDGIASTRLNEILLRLNTGLVNIIASFLNHSHHSEPRLDYRGLTALSEVSRHDSVGVLHQLYQRLMSGRVPAAMIRPDQRSSRSQQRVGKPLVPPKASRIKGPTIAQVTIEDSSKRSQLAVVKPSATSGRKKPSPRLPSNSSSATLVPTVSQLSFDGNKKTQSRSYEKLPPAPKLKKQASAAVLPRKMINNSKPRTRPLAARSQPDLLPPYSRSPPLPSAQPRTVHDAAPKRATPTLYSIASDSTKLGEIPVHRWAVPYDHAAEAALNEQALQNGWPVRDIDGELLVRPKKKFGWFGLRKHAAVT